MIKLKVVKKKIKELSVMVENIIFLLNPIWKYERGYFIFTIIFQGVVIYPLITLVQISSVRLVLNSLVERKSVVEIIIIPLGLEISLLILGLLDLFYSEFYASKKTLDINNKISMEVSEKVLHTDYVNFDDPDFYNNYSHASKYYSSNTNEAFRWLIDLIRAVVTISSLLIMSVASDLFVVFAVVVAMFILTSISKKNNYLNEEKQEKLIPYNRAKFYAAQLFAQREYAIEQKCTLLSKFVYELRDDALVNKKKIIDKYKWLFLKYGVLSRFIDLILNLSIVFYLIFLVIDGKILFGDFAGLVAVTNSFRQNLGIFFGSYTRAHNFNVYAMRIRSFFDKKNIIENTLGEIDIPNGEFDIIFNNICFSYNNSDFSIKNFNLKINKGEKIAFVGENGAGKTTITKLLLRLYDPLSGEILINGNSIKEYNPKLLRLKIGMAFQHTHLYTMPYNKNLSLYYEMNNKELEKASIDLGLDKVLEKYNANYYSQVGREFDGSGIVMSNGEIQKVGLARIMNGEFGILILDEPTASLDPFAEYKLNKIIFDKAQTTTTILISHRLSAVREADRIVFIENGCIIEEGSHDELMVKGGKYCEMFKKQANNYRG